MMGYYGIEFFCPACKLIYFAREAPAPCEDCGQLLEAYEKPARAPAPSFHDWGIEAVTARVLVPFVAPAPEPVPQKHRRQTGEKPEKPSRRPIQVAKPACRPSRRVLEHDGAPPARRFRVPADAPARDEGVLYLSRSRESVYPSERLARSRRYDE